jgi:phosphatidate cytidylyltransferase
MLRTRLWMGAVLVLLAVGVLVIDQYLGPWYPFLFVLVTALGLAACYELLQLLESSLRPPGWLCYLGVAVVIAANWPAHLVGGQDRLTWLWVLGTFTAVVLSAFLTELATFREPGGCVGRIAMTVFLVAYLAWLPSFLVQLRWPADEGRQTDIGLRGTLALALTIFVPKCGDIGAYFTGRFLGRHRMTPTLSPQKTWEGFAGGMVAAALTAFALNRLGPLLPDPAAVGFGLTVGLAGVLGDLAESLIKRDGQKKDASQTVPGFGGVLDVVDSVLFAAPVAYCWLGH